MNDCFKWVELDILNDRKNIVPKESGVYCFFDKEIGEYLYIGSSLNLRNRYSVQKNTLYKNLIKNKYKNVTYMYFITKDFLFIERKMLFKYKPIFNSNLTTTMIKRRFGIGEKIQKAMDGRKLSWLSSKSKIEYNKLSIKMKGVISFTIDELSAIENALGVEFK